MNGYEFNSANIFMSWKINVLFDEASVELNRINVNLSANEKHSLFVLYNIEEDLIER